MEEIESQDLASQDIPQETPAKDVFIAPSIHEQAILAGASYTHHSPIPEVVSRNLSTECILGVDEAGRGPVLGNSSQCFVNMAALTTIKRSYGLWSILPSTYTTPIASRPDTSL